MFTTLQKFPATNRVQTRSFDPHLKLAVKVGNYLKVIHGEAKDLDAKEREAVDALRVRLKERSGYCDGCAAETVGYLVQKRYQD